MRNPRPTCPNASCVNHTKPPAGFYRKKGYRRPKHNHQPIPRYQCKACGRKFCATQVKPIEGQIQFRQRFTHCSLLQRFHRPYGMPVNTQRIPEAEKLTQCSTTYTRRHNGQPLSSLPLPDQVWPDTTEATTSSG